MKVHHLNCATLCPPVGAFLPSLINDTGKLVCHCLVVEQGDGLVLIDTGLGTADVNLSRPHEGFRRLVGPRLRIDETALHQIEGLGFSRRDVRHIVVTHLDIDHAGGLSDFPEAQVHVHATELSAALSPSLREKLRYHAPQWAHGPRWVTHTTDGERWFGFERVRATTGLPPEILMIPLPGHTRGHAAIAVRSDSGWLLHAGDAYFFHGEMDPVRPTRSLGLATMQRLDEVDHAARVANQERLRLFARDHAEVRVFCAHDPTEFERFKR
jgi:glyoxylase-like metal-dependent hydrolase (beta-lactamase superfamily II)